MAYDSVLSGLRCSGIYPGREPSPSPSSGCIWPYNNADGENMWSQRGFDSLSSLPWKPSFFSWQQDPTVCAPKVLLMVGGCVLIPFGFLIEHLQFTTGKVEFELLLNFLRSSPPSCSLIREFPFTRVS